MGGEMALKNHHLDSNYFDVYGVVERSVFLTLC